MTSQPKNALVTMVYSEHHDLASLNLATVNEPICEVLTRHKNEKLLQTVNTYEKISA